MAAQSKLAREEHARAIYLAGPRNAPEYLSDSIIGDVFAFMVEDFAQIYHSARGVRIDPVYVRALRHDVLCCLHALLAHSPTPTDLEHLAESRVGMDEAIGRAA